VFIAFWMLLAMLFASTLTAGITSVLTAWHSDSRFLETPASLSGRRVASVAGSSSAVYARTWAGDVIGSKDIDRAMTLLLNGSVEAVVFHEPELRDWLNGHPGQPVHLSVVSQAMSEYGFVFPLPRPGSVIPAALPLVTRINRVLLKMHETGEIERIEETWLARDREK
jgi:ABC-type amino acid transport substrate-binding protein